MREPGRTEGGREAGEERAGSGIYTMAEAGDNLKKKDFRYLLLLIMPSKKRTQKHFLSSI